ncbi:membrane bound O-acyl transferase family-domain-containing protein [Clohesyomyces aquaticus]|uniref:Membrane bound O-acyl transferase family-domain-containing protein n=1 Tax=Clohesyomyces aquaticus TaxID=1231657 RepID=A0A1Y1Z3M4_9PLEO|nr:membrane bound O-acyl transferase family-domain-containing protein [Clohesyomyces aquaticus]
MSAFRTGKIPTLLLHLLRVPHRLDFERFPLRNRTMSIMFPWIDHPVSLFLRSFLTYVLILAFTHPNSIIRPACLPVFVYHIWKLLNSSTYIFFTHPMYSNLLGGSIFSVMIRYLDTVILRKTSYEAGGPTTTAEGEPLQLSRTKESDRRSRTQGTVCQRILFATSHIFNNRLSNTPWEVKNVPHFDENNPTYTPSKGAFLRQNAFILSASILLLDLSRLASGDLAENAIFFADAKIPFFTRLQDVTIEDVAMRFITTISSIIITYLLFQAMYTCAAILAVGSGLSTPNRWRPLFGSIRDARSLRRAWSLFWHQAMSSCLTGPAKYLTFRLLRLPRRSLISRYILTTIVFVLSGCMHLCADTAAGIPISESGVVRFFATQALGLVIEDFVQGAWRIVEEEGGKSWTLPPIWRARWKAPKKSGVRWWQKGIGYVWVVAWLAWSMPVWTYPAARRSQGEGILPFSILEHFSRTA